MPSFGFKEIIFILLIALLLFGAKKLPEIGRALGQAYRELKKSLQSDTNQTNATSDDKDKDQPSS